MSESVNSKQDELDKKQSDWIVPRNRLGKFHTQIRDELLAAVEPLMLAGFWEGFQTVAEFEKKFGEWRGYTYVAAVSSGSAALSVGLHALGIRPGDEVITVANSDMADTNAIEVCGARVVLCDVCENDYNIDVEKIEALITNKTKVILAVSLFGNPANVKKIRPIADRYGIKILEDAALSTCSTDYGKPLGYFADAVAFSTAGTKPINGMTFGGIIATESKEIYERAKMFSDYGARYKPTNVFPDLSSHFVDGDNLRMHPIDAAFLLVKLPYYDEQNIKRMKVSKWYDEKLKGIDHVILQKLRPESVGVRREYAIRVVSPDGTSILRDHVIKVLIEKGIQVTAGYTPPIHKRPVGKLHQYPGMENLKVSERLGNEMVTLPNDIYTTEEEVQYVADVLREAVKG